MKVVDGKLFSSVNEDFKGVEVVETVENKDINWSNFEARDAVISCKENCREAAISLDNALIDGGLTINGLNQKLDSIKLVDVQAQRIRIYNVKAKRLEITGEIGAIEVLNSKIDDYHICGEVKEYILFLRSGKRTSSIEINGYAKKVRLKNVIANDFKFKSFKTEKVMGEDIKIEELYLPTDWNSDLRRIDVKKLLLSSSGKPKGAIYNLKNATLEF